MVKTNKHERTKQERKKERKKDRKKEEHNRWEI